MLILHLGYLLYYNPKHLQKKTRPTRLAPLADQFDLRNPSLVPVADQRIALQF